MDQILSNVVPATPLTPEDFYFEETKMVFTAAYHLKRGYCCGSGCRHCPYGFEATGAPEASTEEPPAGAGGPVG